MIPLFRARDVRNRIAVWMSDAASMIILFGTGIYMACISWQRWADITIDYGVELYIPWQLTKGKVLCLDIWQLYGPFSQYLNSFVFRVFGTGVMNLALFNMILIVVLGYVLYRIFLELSDKITAAVVVAFFLSVFAFSQYVGCANYNYVCPYSHELTHGVILSFIALLLFMRYIRTGSRALLFTIGLLIGAVLLTKMEVFAAIFPSIVLGLIFFALIDKTGVKDCVKTAALFLAALLLPLISFLIYFSRHMSLSSAFSAIMMQYNLLSDNSMTSQKFIMWVTGLDRPAYNFMMLLSAAGRYVYIFLLIILSAVLTSGLKNKSIKITVKTLILAVVVILIPSMVRKTPWMELGRPLPVIMLLFGAYYFIRIALSIRDRQKALSILPFFVLSLFSFAMLLKIILNSRLYHYGFVLAMPASLLFVMFFTYQMPGYLGKFFGNKLFIRSLNLILILAVISGHVAISRRHYALKTFRFSDGIDTMMTWDPRITPQGPCGRHALAAMGKIMKSGETFVVFPEGVMYNYLSRHDNPTPYYDFKPVATDVWNKEYYDALRKNPPDYVVLTDRDTSDIGGRYFGRDYALDLYAWVTANYKNVYQVGSPLTGAGYGVSILKRSDNK